MVKAKGTVRFTKMFVLLFLSIFACMFYIGIVSRYTVWQQQPILNSHTRIFPTVDNIATRVFNCSNVDELIVEKPIGAGTSRRAFLASYRGIKVAVKVVNTDIDENCVRVFRENRHKHIRELLFNVRNYCESKDVRHMLLEIIYHSILKSPNIIENLGFCIRDYPDISQNKGNNENVGPSERKLPVLNRSIISVYEYGSVIKQEDIEAMPMSYRLNMSRDLAFMMKTMTDTPVGPVAMVDFRVRHLAMVEGVWKMFDLGLFEFGVLPCGRHRSNNPILNGMAIGGWMRDNSCSFGVQCVNGTCPGLLEKLNGVIMCRDVLGHILGDDFFDNRGKRCSDMKYEDFIAYIDSAYKTLRETESPTATLSDKT